MALYWSDFDSNDCELPCKQATPPLVREVWTMMLHKEEIIINMSKALVSNNCALAVDPCISIIDNPHKLDRILESANLNEYELTDLPN